MICFFVVMCFNATYPEIKKMIFVIVDDIQGDKLQTCLYL